jgi:hypothetical protein
MAGIVEHLNALGRPFVGWSLAMLVQSSVLILLLLVIDLLIRRRVRAVVRYAIWSLVLVKLVLPPSLASPIGLAALAPPESKIADLFDPAGLDAELQPWPDPPVLAKGDTPQGTPSDGIVPVDRPSPGEDGGPGFSVLAR